MSARPSIAWAAVVIDLAIGFQVLFQRPVITPYRQINDLILSLREMWSRWRRSGPLVSALPPRRDVQVTVLASDLSAVRPEQLSGLTCGKLELLGFRFGGPGAPLGLPLEVVEFGGCAFPGFHQVLAAALIRVSGARILALTPDLPGLGLGLLHNYHCGTPLALIGGEPAGVAEVDWSDPQLLDPLGEAWRRYLAAFVGQVPRKTGATPGVLPAARRFAVEFARFYDQTRSGR